jgi:hypothetical protein
MPRPGVAANEGPLGFAKHVTGEVDGGFLTGSELFAGEGFITLRVPRIRRGFPVLLASVKTLRRNAQDEAPHRPRRSFATWGILLKSPGNLADQ